MQHHVDIDNNDGQIEGIPVDLDERTSKTAAKTEDYVSICENGNRVVLRVYII